MNTLNKISYVAGIILCCHWKEKLPKKKDVATSVNSHFTQSQITLLG